MKKSLNFIRKIALLLSGMAMAACVFVANNSTNLCGPIWSYEIEMPSFLKEKC